MVPRHLLQTRSTGSMGLLIRCHVQGTTFTKSVRHPYLYHDFSFMPITVSLRRNELQFDSRLRKGRENIRLYVCAQSEREQNPGQQQPKIRGFSIVGTSVVFYGLMTIGSILLGNAVGYDIKSQFLDQKLDLAGSAPYLTVLGIFFALSTGLSEVVPQFKELKQVYQRIFIPTLQDVPLWGLALLAIGAGVGEEAAFRAFLQTWLMEKAANFPAATPASAVATGLMTSSVIFGAAHALTPFYALYATCAGAIFGVEYLTCGLPAAAFTHALYDFVALAVLINLWKTEGKSLG